MSEKEVRKKARLYCSKDGGRCICWILGDRGCAMIERVVGENGGGNYALPRIMRNVTIRGCEVLGCAEVEGCGVQVMVAVAIASSL